MPGVEFTRDGTVVVWPSMMTGCPGVFAGGDMVPAERTVTVAAGHGKRAARSIDAWLRGEPLDRPGQACGREFDMLHPWYLLTPPGATSQSSPAERVADFDEVWAG